MKNWEILRHLFPLTIELVVDSMTGSNQKSSHVLIVPSLGSTWYSWRCWDDFHWLALEDRMIVVRTELWQISTMEKIEISTGEDVCFGEMRFLISGTTKKFEIVTLPRTARRTTSRKIR